VAWTSRVTHNPLIRGNDQNVRLSTIAAGLHLSMALLVGAVGRAIG
jgi:hypothetical protein